MATSFLAGMREGWCCVRHLLPVLGFVKEIPTLLSIAFVVVAAAMLFRFRLHGVLTLAAWYLICQAMFAAVCWVGLQTNSQDSEWYHTTFSICFGLVLVLSVAVVCYAGLALGKPELLKMLLLIALLLFRVGYRVVLPQITNLYKPDEVPAQLSLAVFQGCILLFCGLLSWVVLSTPMEPETFLNAT